jgi:hypothetical protein
MGTVIIELIAGITILGTFIFQKTRPPPKVIPYCTYTVCFTTGDTPGTIVHTPWCKKICQTEDDYEHDYEQVFSIAMDPSKNKYFRECGYTGMSIIDVDTGMENAWCRMLNENYS